MNEPVRESEEERIRRQDEINRYADAMIRRDKETPQWLREHLTGGVDPDARR